MSSLEAPVLPPARLASHDRLKYCFIAAPFLEEAFREFLEGNPDSTLLESDRIYEAVSRFYVLGRKLSVNCWTDGVKLSAPDLEAMRVELELARACRYKKQGGRLWDHARRLWKEVLREELQSRKRHGPFTTPASDTRHDALRIALTHMIRRLRQVWCPPKEVPEAKVDLPRPKRIAGRTSRPK